LPDVYRCASLFSLITERGIGQGEGLPLTPIEAMACGVPILVGNQDGSREAVVEGTNGRVLDPFDIASHTLAIEQIACNPDLRRRLGEESARLANERFSFAQFRAKHATLYESMT
jgi:phosphatidylinositol alpha-1,6-mannosyltransferase